MNAHTITKPPPSSKVDSSVNPDLQKSLIFHSGYATNRVLERKYVEHLQSKKLKQLQVVKRRSQKRQAVMKAKANNRLALITGSASLLLTIAGVVGSGWVSYQMWETMPAWVNDPTLSLWLLYSTTATVTIFVATLFQLRVLHLTHKASSWWLTFACFILAATQTGVLAYTLWSPINL